jgi:hypothetical protein
MTPEQKSAIANPCRFAFETANQKLIHMITRGSLVLSVNTGYE